MHDLAQEFEGNVDHLVSGPTGIFMVETKHRIFLPTHLTKAKRQAARLSSQLGGTWVTAVICLDRDLEPRKYGVAWAMGRSSVVDWIAAQKNRPVAFDDLARFADRL